MFFTADLRTCIPGMYRSMTRSCRVVSTGLPGFAMFTTRAESSSRELELDANAVISDILHDGTGKLITFD